MHLPNRAARWIDQHIPRPRVGGLAEQNGRLTEFLPPSEFAFAQQVAHLTENRNGVATVEFGAAGRPGQVFHEIHPIPDGHVRPMLQASHIVEQNVPVSNGDDGRNIDALAVKLNELVNTKLFFQPVLGDGGKLIHNLLCGQDSLDAAGARLQLL